MVRALRHPCYRLLKTSDYRCLITEVIVPHRDGLGVLLRCQSQSHFAKWQINIKLFFFSVKTIARNLGKIYHSLNAGHLQLDESVRLNTLVIRCFFTSPTTVSKLLSPFYKKRGHKKRFFSHHHKFRAPTTSKTKAEARHHPSVLKVNFHHRLNVIYGRKFYATVEFHPKTLTRYDTIWYLDVNGLNSESFNLRLTLQFIQLLQIH